MPRRSGIERTRCWVKPDPLNILKTLPGVNNWQRRRYGHTGTREWIWSEPGNDGRMPCLWSHHTGCFEFDFLWMMQYAHCWLYENGQPARYGGRLKCSGKRIDEGWQPPKRKHPTFGNTGHEFLQKDHLPVKINVCFSLRTSWINEALEAH